MSTYAATREHGTWNPWPGMCALAAIPVVILLFTFVFIPWANRADARDAVRSQQRLAAIHKLGFVDVTNQDLYASSNYGQPSAFQYLVGTCSIEVILAGSGANTRSYIVLKSVEDSVLFVTYRQLTHIPQTAACFSR